MAKTQAVSQEGKVSGIKGQSGLKITGLLLSERQAGAVVGAQRSITEGALTPSAGNAHVWVPSGRSAHREQPGWAGEGQTRMQKCHGQTL